MHSARCIKIKESFEEEYYEKFMRTDEGGRPYHTEDQI